MDITASPKLREPEETHTLVVYDPKTGAIIHRHYVVTFPGARKRSKEELEARAIEIARSQKNYRKPLAVLHADWEAFSEAMEYKIDIRTGKIVRKPLVSIPTDNRPKGQKKGAGKRSR